MLLSKEDNARKKNHHKIMVLRCALKNPSLMITVRHYSSSLLMSNSYPHDGIFNPTSPTIKFSYGLILFVSFKLFFFFLFFFFFVFIVISSIEAIYQNSKWKLIYRWGYVHELMMVSAIRFILVIATYDKCC